MRWCLPWQDKVAVLQILNTVLRGNWRLSEILITQFRQPEQSVEGKTCGTERTAQINPVVLEKEGQKGGELKYPTPPTEEQFCLLIICTWMKFHKLVAITFLPQMVCFSLDVSCFISTSANPSSPTFSADSRKLQSQQALWTIHILIWFSLSENIVANKFSTSWIKIVFPSRVLCVCFKWERMKERQRACEWYLKVVPGSRPCLLIFQA